MARESVRGRLLVAAPSLTDPNFERSVVLVLEHTVGGAFGLVLDRATDLDLEGPLVPWARLAADPLVLFHGGPVQPDAAFCLARLRAGVPTPPGCSPVGDTGIGVVDLDADPFELLDSFDGARIFIGYAGWSPGQLDAELREEAWFVVDAAADDIVTDRTDDLWRTVLRRQRGPLSWVANFPDDPDDN